jgi:hypothetical protein
MKRISLQPSHPDRICWGCDKYCPADDLACGNGTIRTPHPAELFGADWLEWLSRMPGGRAQVDGPSGIKRDCEQSHEDVQ